MSLKRDRSSHGSQVYDFHPNTPQTQHEENEMPERKKRRTETFDKHASVQKWSRSSDQNSQQSSGNQHVELDPPPVLLNKTVDFTADDNILSRYKIGRLLGEGGFGRVYKGKRWEDGLKVAVKIGKKTKSMKNIDVPGHPKPLPLEIGLMLMVNTEPKLPEIIQLLDWQDEPDHYIMILERPSPCQDLFEFISCHGEPLQEDVARFILLQATRAARFCCRRGVFHRDIKMENLLVNTQTLEVKLIDFGCGDLLRESGYKKFVGTDEFRPPEYHRTRVYHCKPTTVWSLGVLLFNMVCGRYPKLRDRQMMDEGAWSKPGLSNECCDLIQGLLHKYPSQRMDLMKILRHEWFKVKK